MELLEMNNNQIREKLKSGDFKIILKRGQSKVWNIFGKIRNSNEEEIRNVVGCRVCFAVLKHDSRSTSNLNKHKCFIDSEKRTEQINLSGDIKKQSTNIFTEWIIQNCRPFAIVKDEGLKKVTQFLISVGAKYGNNVNIDTLIPHNTTVSRNIENLYKVHFDRIRNMIGSVTITGFGITTDLWSDNYLRKSYLGLTIHFIDQGKLVNTVLGLKSMNGDKCTAENILLKVHSLLDEFHCRLDETCTIVTDKGANMKAAFRNYNHIYCINHLMHNVLQKSIENVEVVFFLYKSCSKLVTYFKKSGLNAQLTTCLQSFCPTRWNTLYYMFASIGKNWAEIVNILRQNRELSRIDGVNDVNINAILVILEPFEKASKMLEGDVYPTLHFVLIYMQQLRKKCASLDTDIDFIKSFKCKILENLESIVFGNLSITHKVALFLLPPANKLTQFSDAEKFDTKLECKRLMAEFIHNSQNDPDSQNMLSNENIELLSDFLQPTRLENTDDRIHQEITKYESTYVCMSDDFSILSWWDSRKAEFPLLYKVSCKILCIPASSAPSERIFSNARQALSETRTTIGKDAEKVNRLIFLHQNINLSNLHNELNDLDLLTA